MKVIRPLRASLCLFLLLFVFLPSCGKANAPAHTETEAVPTGSEDTGSDEPSSAAPILLFPEEGAEISLLSEEMTLWIKDPSLSSLDELCDYSEKCLPRPVAFRWDGRGAEKFELLVSRKNDMSDPLRFVCGSEEYAAEDLLPGTVYYWQVASFDGNGSVSSLVRSFRTAQTPRTVSVPGMSNVRDLGGKNTSFGKKVRFGMVYRGADLARLTGEGIEKAVGTLGIRTELDLRHRLEDGSSPFGKEVRYISVTSPHYTGIAERESRAELRDALLVFADPDNYPVYFHCSIGRDRTGTIAFLLLALLGVGEEEIDLDYELSFFSSFGGYVASGAVEKSLPSTMFAAYDGMKDIIANGRNRSLCENAELFVKKIGLTDRDIESIRSALLE